MGVKDMLNKFVGTIGGADDDYETDEFEDEEPMEEEQPQRRQPVAAATRRSSFGYGQTEQPLKMMIVEPETFDDSQSIADYLRDRKPVIINFESTAPDVAKRIVDFISGATYALDGNIQKVGKDIFLCVPSSVTVDRGKHDYNDFNATQLSWGNKAPEGGSTLQQ